MSHHICIIRACVFAQVALLVAFFAYVWRKQSKAKKAGPPSVLSVFGKIVLTSFQQNSTALSYGFQWDALMTGFLETQDSVTSFGATPPCVMLGGGNLLSDSGG